MKKLPITYTVIFLAALLSFYNLGHQPLEKWDEETNAQVVQELVYTGSFPYLTLHGRPFFEKPPLWYYLTGLVVSLNGISPTTLRLVSASSGFFLMLLVYFKAGKWYGSLAAPASALTLFLTNHLFTTNSGGFFATHNMKTADADALQMLLLMVSFFCFSPNSHITFYILGAVASALAVLTKGPLGILPIGIWFVYILINRQKNPIHVIHVAIVVFSFLLTLLPWYFLMITKYGQLFTEAHFHYHIVRRIGEPLEGHDYPIWYYLTVLSNPRVFALFPLAVISIVSAMTHPQLRRDYHIFAPLLLVMSVLAIVTVMRTKLTWYILPFYPPVSLLVGRFVPQLFKKRQSYPGK